MGIISFKQGDGYVKLFRGMGMKLVNELTAKEIETLVFLSDYICYEDGMIRKGGDKRGHALSIQELSELRGIRYDTFRRTLYNLESKGAIYFGHEKHIYMNPYIFCRGGNVSEETIDMFDGLKWNVGNADNGEPIYDKLNVYLRGLTDEWKNNSMRFCDYKCVVTGGSFDVVHHVKQFSEIVLEVFRNLNFPLLKCSKDYSKSELDLIKKRMAEVHMEYGYGACLCNAVHKFYHDIYGNKKSNLDNFVEFLENFKNGRYEDWVGSHGIDININENYILYLKTLKAFQSKTLLLTQ